MPFCHPSKITVPPDRFRKLTKESVAHLAEGIKQIGQLQAVLVNNDMVLIAGHRRLEACRLLGRDVWYSTEEEANLTLDNPLLKKVAEYQENFQRQDFTQEETNKAIAEIDRLMREVYGSKKPGPGEEKEGWTQTDTAKKLGFKSVSSVSEAIKVTKAIEAGVPGVAEAKTTQEALSIVKKITRIEAAKELAKRRTAAGDDAEIQDPLQYFGDKIILGDCVEKMKDLPPSICDLFITDPPFGIEFEEYLKLRGQHKRTSAHQGTYKDDFDHIFNLLSNTIIEIARVGKPDCIVLMFCAVQYWHILKEFFEESGFHVHKKPLIWVKASVNPFRLLAGRSQNPQFNPGSSYEAILYARRGTPIMAQQGLGDVFVHQTLSTTDKFHIAQRPVPLMEELIARFYHPGTNPVLIDPFAGSGTTIWAAFKLGIRLCFGYELDPEFRERAVAFLVNEYMRKEEGKGDPVTIDLDLDEDF